MGLIAQAKADIKQITSNEDDFGVVLTFTAPTAEVATVAGIHTKKHFAIDTEGNAMNSKQAHISVSEELLTEADYPVRTYGEVNLKNHKVAVADSTGTVCTYIIKQWFPNETVGLITCLLEVFE